MLAKRSDGSVGRERAGTGGGAAAGVESWSGMILPRAAAARKAGGRKQR